MYNYVSNTCEANEFASMLFFAFIFVNNDTNASSAATTIPEDVNNDNHDLNNCGDSDYNDNSDYNYISLYNNNYYY